MNASLRPLKWCTTMMLLLLFLVVRSASAQSRLAKLEGIKPYTPNRLEWLALELNAAMRVDLSPETSYALDFIPLGSEDTILLYVIYLPSVDRRIMNGSIETARKVISISSRSHGWSSWLKVKERVEMKDPSLPSK